MRTLVTPDEVQITDVYRHTDWTMYYCVALGDWEFEVDHGIGSEIDEISQLVYGMISYEDEGGNFIFKVRGACNERTTESGVWIGRIAKGSEWACWSPAVALYSRESVIVPAASQGQIDPKPGQTDQTLLVSDGPFTVDGTIYQKGDLIPFDSPVNIVADVADALLVHVWR